MTQRRRLVRVAEITIRRSVRVAGASVRLRDSWRCLVCALRTTAEAGRGAEIWSRAERTQMAEMMRGVR